MKINIHMSFHNMITLFERLRMFEASACLFSLRFFFYLEQFYGLVFLQRVYNLTCQTISCKWCRNIRIEINLCSERSFANK